MREGKKPLKEAPIPKEIRDRADAIESLSPGEFEKRHGPVVPDDFDPDAETADLDE